MRPGFEHGLQHGEWAGNAIESAITLRVGLAWVAVECIVLVEAHKLRLTGAFVMYSLQVLSFLVATLLS